MKVLALRIGGRVSRRGLLAIAPILLCVAGVIQLTVGMIVPAKAVVAQIMLEHAFDRSVAMHHPQKPWPWADMAPVARISVPRLKVDRIVLDTGSGQAMAFGPTLLPGGAGIGEAGTAVIAAHRDTHFRFLAQVRPGDVIVIEGVDGTVRRYRVTGGQIVRWDRFAIAADPATQELALSTCYPFGALSHGPLRYVLHATLISPRAA